MNSEPSVRSSRFANIPLFCWIAAIALFCLAIYLDEKAPYRKIAGYSKDRVEDHCLWLAVLVAAAGLVFAGVALVSIWRAKGGLKGMWRALIGLVLNAGTAPVVLLVILVRNLFSSMPT